MRLSSDTYLHVAHATGPGPPFGSKAFLGLRCVGSGALRYEDGSYRSLPWRPTVVRRPHDRHAQLALIRGWRLGCWKEGEQLGDLDGVIHRTVCNMIHLLLSICNRRLFFMVEVSMEMMS